MRALAAKGLVRACMDNSDGLLPTLQQLASSNNVSAVLNFDQLPVPSAGAFACEDPQRLWLGWGDWNVIAAVEQSAVDIAKQTVMELGFELIEIGNLSTANPLLQSSATV